MSSKPEDKAFVEIFPELCKGCCLCLESCVPDVLKIHDKFNTKGYHYAYYIGEGCTGCGVCYYQCPAEAIQLVEQHAGHWFHSDTRIAPLFHAHLFAGQENSGKVVTRVKQQARQWAVDTKADLLLVDGPPGIGCPGISASAGADLVLHVGGEALAG